MTKPVNFPEHERFIADDEAVPCLFAPAAPQNDRGVLCLFPQFVGDEIARAPFDTLAAQLVAAGIGVVSFPSKWGDFDEQVPALASGRDTFVETQRRISAVAAACIKRRAGRPTRVVVLGISRFGYAAMHAMAHDPVIDAVIASSPVTHWPTLHEFAAMQGHPLLDKHDLRHLVERLAPRPLLILIGNDDQRVGTDHCRHLAGDIEKKYDIAGASEAFTFRLLDVPGHETTQVFHDQMIRWLVNTCLPALLNQPAV